MGYLDGLQALVRERIKDWGAGLCKSLGKKLVELTGTVYLKALHISITVDE